MSSLKWPLNKAPCVPAEENEFILYATRYSIHRYDLASGVSEELPLAGLRGAVALDFDYDHNCLYWADVTLDIIQVRWGVLATHGIASLHHTHPGIQMFILGTPPSELSVNDCAREQVPHLLF